MAPRHTISLIALALTLAACAAPTAGTDTSNSAPTDSTSPPQTTQPPVTQPPLTQPSEPTGECSASGLAAVPVAQDLPPAVENTRAAIVEAAVACDFERLASLTGELFTYSFGGSDDPAGFWRDQESRTGEKLPLEMLVKVLDLPFISYGNDGTDYYTWPSATPYPSWEEVPEADREALLAIYDEEDLDSFEQFGGYIGYRVVITDLGDWIVFVAGD